MTQTKIGAKPESSSPRSCYNQFAKLPRNSQKQVVRRLIRSEPKLTLALIEQAKRQNLLKRRRLMRKIGRTRRNGVAVKLYNGLHARIFRLDNPRLESLIETMRNRYEHPGAAPPSYLCPPIKPDEYDLHYVADIKIQSEHVYVVYRPCKQLMYVINSLKSAYLEASINYANWVAYKHLFESPASIPGKVLLESIAKGVPPAITTLLSTAR